MIYTHVLKSAAAGTSSPLDGLMMAMTTTTMPRAGVDDRDGAGEDEGADDSEPRSAFAARRPPRVREPLSPCYRATPSSTAAATSAS
jgi:hypothetical protein